LKGIIEKQRKAAKIEQIKLLETTQITKNHSLTKNSAVVDGHLSSDSSSGEADVDALEEDFEFSDSSTEVP